MKCKKLLSSVLNKMLDPIRARRREYEQDIPEIYNILKKGFIGSTRNCSPDYG